jgi:hypothetical protein
VIRVPIPASAADAEIAQIHAAYRAVFNEAYYSTSLFADSPMEDQEELKRQLQQAERAGDKPLAAAALYHKAIDLGVQSVVDTYLASRPQENGAWERYTEAQQEANESKDIGFRLDRSLAERAFSGQSSEFAS